TQQRGTRNKEKESAKQAKDERNEKLNQAIQSKHSNASGLRARKQKPSVVHLPPAAGHCAVMKSSEAVSAIQPQLMRSDTVRAPALDSEKESMASERMLQSELEGVADREEEAEKLIAALELTGMPERDLSLRRAIQAHFAGKKKFLNEGLVAE